VRGVKAVLCKLLFPFVLVAIAGSLSTAVENDEAGFTAYAGDFGKESLLDVPIEGAGGDEVLVVYSPNTDEVRSLMEDAAGLLGTPLDTSSNLRGFPSSFEALEFLQFSEDAQAVASGVFFDIPLNPSQAVRYDRQHNLDQLLNCSRTPMNNCVLSGTEDTPVRDSLVYMLVSPANYYDDFTFARIEPANFALTVRTAVDNAILRAGGKAKGVIETTLELPPRERELTNQQSEDKAYIVVHVVTPMLLSLSMLPFLVGTAVSVHGEMSGGLLTGLKMMGLNDAPYWLASLVAEVPMAAAASLCALAGGHVSSMTIIVNTNSLIIFLMFFLLALNMVVYGQLVAVLFHSPTWFNGGLLVTVMSFLLFAWLGYALPDAMFNPGMIWWSFFGPIQNFAALLTFITYGVTGSTAFGRYSYDDGEGAAEQENWYSWHELESQTFPFRYHVEAWSGAAHLLTMFFDVLITLAVVYYIHSVSPGTVSVGRGRCFCISDCFSTSGSRRAAARRNISLYAAGDVSSVMSDLDEDIHSEVQTTNARAAGVRGRQGFASLEVLSVSKTYNPTKRCGFGPAAVRAVDTVTFGTAGPPTVDASGTVIALLGHNGCGKSTTIKMMTGALAPTSGDVFVGGRSVVHETSAVRRNIGVMQQTDILWPQLTVREHVRLFARLRMVPSAQLEAELNRRIAEVHLTKVADIYASRLSQGMQRRLSFACALAGGPRILFLDEPTAATDVMHRRLMWDAIERAKVGRTILITTHQMDEANALGTKVVVMALGRVRAVGSTAHLKDRFGIGYRLSTMSAPKDVSKVIRVVRERLPSAAVQTSQAGNVTFAVDGTRMAELQRFVQFLEKGKAAEIRDWNIEQTNMEDVFLQVTHGRGQEIGDEDDEEESRSLGDVPLSKVTQGRPVFARELIVKVNGANAGAVGLEREEVQLNELRHLIVNQLVLRSAPAPLAGDDDVSVPADFFFTKGGEKVASSLEGLLSSIHFEPVIELEATIPSASASGQAGGGKKKKKSRGGADVGEQ
jgi:ABC-type multidrug transport system ATPase subunit